MINTEPINKQDVLIRLLKDGHISNEEFTRWLDIIKPISFFDKISMVLRGVSPKKARLRINDHFNWFYWRVIMSLDSELPPRKDPMKEPLPLRKRESMNKTTQGMHPKTWAFLKKSSEFTQLEEGFENKIQSVQPKKGGGFWITVEGKGI